MEIQDAIGAHVAGLPVKRETGPGVVCRVSEPEGSPLFDIVNERKRSAGGCILAVLMGNHRDNRNIRRMRFLESQ
jgi:hypothetical protein